MSGFFGTMVAGILKQLPVRLVRRSSVEYDEDGLITLHSAGFVDQQRFAAAYESGKATGSWGGADIRWRAHVACWAAELGMQRAGDFVECGVNRGGLARTVMSYVNFSASDRRFWLLDTFRGLDNAVLSDAEKSKASRWQYADCYDDVVTTFAAVPNARIVRGLVPDTLSQVTAERVAFLSIDMNCATPEIAAFRYFWPRLTAGAVVLLDDYGWIGHEEQRAAFDALAGELGFGILSLPTGQGVILKTP
jgi:O-methyltransferase